MLTERIIDGLDTYFVVFQSLDPDEPNALHVHSVWRFRTGRSRGEKMEVRTCPWSVREMIAHITTDETHL